MPNAPEIEDIVESIDELAKRGGFARSRAFASWFAINFFNLDEDDAIEAAAADGPNDQGIDIVFVDHNTQTIFFIQAHCPENFSKKTPKPKWDAVASSVSCIKNPRILSDSGRPDLAELVHSSKEKHPDYELSIGLISLGKRSDAIGPLVHALNEESEAENISYFYYSGEDLVEKYNALVEAENGIPEDSICFSGDVAQDQGEYGRAWIGCVSALELKRLHDAHKDKLFAGNIRLFLGARKGGINDQMIKTAKSEPGVFWALNNGITIVADSANITSEGDPDADGAISLNVKRFSIVNGCQTTSSLIKAGAPEKAKTLLRVIAAKSGLRRQIVQYNNSQNAVKIWTVRSGDEIQTRLRATFSDHGINYAPKQSGARRSKDSSKIELDKVTQYLASREQGFLIQAINNKSELFDEPYQKIYRRDITPSEVYTAWIVGQTAEEERQSLVDGLGDDRNVGLLGVTSSYWIIYCTYKLISKINDLRSPQITIPKQKTKEFHSAVRKYVQRAAEMFYDAAVDTYDREEYGSFKSTLRSAKFLSKIDSKINNRLVRVTGKGDGLPRLVSVCKSAQVE